MHKKHHSTYFRKFRRWIFQESRTFTRSSDASKSTKDFSWHLRRENPFDQPKKNWRFKTIIMLGMTASIGTVGIFLYHPFFKFQDIHIEGIERIDQNDFLNTVTGILTSKRFFLLHGDSYLTVDLDDLHAILFERFPLESLTIKKTFPHSLIFHIEEKISTIIFDDGNTYAYLGLDGNVLETIRRVGEDEWVVKNEATTSTPDEKIHVPPVGAIEKEMGAYPIVYYSIRQTTSTPLLAKETITSIITWYQKISHESNIPIGYFLLENREREGSINTRLGWVVKAVFDDTVSDQFSRLMMMLKKHEPNYPSSYVDVRYPWRVYWK